MANRLIVRQNDNRIDQLEKVMITDCPAVDCPLTHRYTKGLYIREIFMPKGTLITSKIHKTQHPFTISQGSVMVSVDGQAWEKLSAPYTGITQPGTRRVLYILEDCIWTTYHVRREITGEEDHFDTESKELIALTIEHRIIKSYTNKLIKKICHS